MSSPRAVTSTAVWIAASLVWVGVLLIFVLMASAGSGGNSVIEASGTAPVGAYTFPPNFTNGRAPGADFTTFGMAISTDQLTNPATLVELVVELSFDGGASWPQGCVNAAGCLCHHASQDATRPPQSTFCAQTLKGGVYTKPIHMECTFGRTTDANTRFRGRMNVCGAPATGTIVSTWR